MSTVATPAVSCQQLTMRFGATQALKGVDLDVAKGSVHALVGENGAGKSTCLGLIGGRISPTSGMVSIFGRPLDHGDPRASREAGVAVIYQELTISPHLSTQANVFLGNELRSRGMLRHREMRSAFLDLCAEMEVDLPPDVPAGRLSVAGQQLLEIQRALIAEPRIILLDEPTAALAEHEREVLFRILRDLRNRGVTTMLVSHNLDEVLEISDFVTVFRNGNLVETRAADKWSKSTLVEKMLGAEVAERPRSRSVSGTDGKVLMRVHNLVVPGALGPINFELHEGEILGIGGVVGSGRSCLLSALAGLIPKASGEIEIKGVTHPWPRRVPAARRHGIALVPEDRQQSGLFQCLPAMDNVVISDYGQTSQRGVLIGGATRRAAVRASKTVAFDPNRLPVPAAGLSGGNQQKLLLARWQHCPPVLLLADEPTRGIDIGAKAEIMATLGRAVDDGMGLILVSSELEELEQHADRVVVLSEGSQVGEVSHAQGDLTVKNILNLAFRAEERQ